jgi:3-oxoacyl-[acyl-carrier protein] reductase
MLENQVALITGASRGIGHAIALALGAAGARIVGTATTAEGAAQLSAALAAQGIDGRGAQLDVSSAASIEALLGELERTAQLPTLLINNAAITRDGLLLRMKPADWDAVLATNLTAVFRLSKACVRHMMKERRGRIVNLTSVVGVTGNAGQSNYAAAKAGLIGFTKSLAQEIASRHITVNAVAPGFIDTDMTHSLAPAERAKIERRSALHRMPEVEDVANLVEYLLSEKARNITGTTMTVDAGNTA